MSVRLKVVTVAASVLLIAGAAPAVARKQARAHPQHRIVALSATGHAQHQWRLNGTLSPGSGRQSFPAPFPSGFTCQVYVGFATNNNPREESTVDSEQQGFQVTVPRGVTIGILMTSCQGKIPASDVVRPGLFRSICYQINQFPTGPATIQGNALTAVFRDGEYHSFCTTIRVPFS